MLGFLLGLFIGSIAGAYLYRRYGADLVREAQAEVNQTEQAIGKAVGKDV